MKYSVPSVSNCSHMYRGKIPIAPFTMCDDLFVISECGYQTELVAAYLNCQARFNFLQFGLTKCFKMHVGKFKENYKCRPVYLDSWNSQEVEDNRSGNIQFQENYIGKIKIKEVSTEKYLGTKLNADGTNIIDITTKCNRGIGTINKIQTILETKFFGKFYFEVGKTLIDSMLLGSLLTNIEVSYNLTMIEIEKLQKCHEMGLRKLLMLPSKTPIKMLYLLTGSVPIEFIVPRRRLVYLHHILNQDENSLLKTFFFHQLETRKSKDWATQVIKDLNNFGINYNFEEIKNMSKVSWKKLVKTKSIEKALNYLNFNQGSKSQKSNELRLAPYLTSCNEDFELKTSSFIAKVQTHMIENIKCNFKEHYKPNLVCNSCNINECNQKHLLECLALIGSNELLTYIPNYSDIFDNNNIPEQMYISRLMIDNLKKKKMIENLD